MVRIHPVRIPAYLTLNFASFTMESLELLCDNVPAMAIELKMDDTT